MGFLEELFTRTAPIQWWEVALALTLGSIGVLGAWSAIMLWRARNGGRVTRWIVFALTALACSLIVGCVVPITVLYRLELSSVVGVRLCFWASRILDASVICFFAFGLLPTRRGE